MKTLRGGRTCCKAVGKQIGNDVTFFTICPRNSLLAMFSLELNTSENV